MLRVRFAPSPTGYLHIGSARTFIFNWLYARRNGGTVILRIDDTDVERSTQASLDSIFEGLQWLDLGWDEQYRQSDRIELHKKMAQNIFERGHAYRDFSPLDSNAEDKSNDAGPWLCNPGMRELSREESDARAAKGEPFVLRFLVPRDAARHVVFKDGVYGEQSKSAADIEDFALLRSNGMPTYHMASCADDIDLGITQIIRGQDHLSNTFKHILIFEAADGVMPQFAHLPLLIAPDGAKLSKRKHGSVVSVTTYRDGGFLPHAYINFLCLLGWSPKDDREQMTRQEIVDAFSFEGIHRSNAVVNFSNEDPFDPKAVWLNAELIRTLPLEDLATHTLPFIKAAGYNADEAKILQLAPLFRERIKTFSEAAAIVNFFLIDELPPYDSAELIPQKGDAAMALAALRKGSEVLAMCEFDHHSLDAALRAGSQELKIKPGQMFQPIRVAVCGRKNAPPLFETLEVLGRETCLKRIGKAIEMLKDQQS